MSTAVSGGSYSPQGLTCAQLGRAVVDYIQGGDDADLLAVANREINFAIDECNARRWKKLVTYQDITLVAATSAYDLATDFKDPLIAHFVDASGRRRRVQYEEWRTFLDRFDDVTSWTNPDFYSIDYNARQLSLQGAPDATFVSTYPTLTLRYYRRLSYCVDDSGTPGGPPEFSTFLTWRARAGLAAIRGEQALSTRADAKANAIYSELIRSDNNLVTDWE